MEKILELLPISNVTDVSPVIGGDVNESYKIDAGERSYFLKVHKNAEASFFECEKAGLKLFEENGIFAPRALASGEADGSAYLFMTYHKEERAGSQEDLARVIADIHKIKSPDGKFGFPYPFIGTACNFDNEFKDSWKEVFLYERMDKLKSMLVKFDLWEERDLEIYE